MGTDRSSPPVLYNSVDNVPSRLENIKNTTLFYEDLKNDKLPQWMFISMHPDPELESHKEFSD